MTVDEMIRYLEDCPYSDRQEPQKIAAKLRAAEELKDIIRLEHSTTGISDLLYEAYERAGENND